MERRNRMFVVPTTLMLVLAAAIVLATVGSARAASATAVVPYQLDGVAFYTFGAPADLVAGAPAGCPDTGFVTITDNGNSTFTGTIGFNAVTGYGVPSNSSYAVTLTRGSHVSVSIVCESSNVGGFNGANGTTQSGALFFMKGTVSLGTDVQGVDLSVFDKDIHSGQSRTNPFGVTLDNYILQGGDPLGRDTGDSYETSQASGSFQFAQLEQPIAASGTAVSATEGAAYSGPVATFTDPDTAAAATEYSATINWGDGSPADAGVIAGGAGGFTVSGAHAYAEEGSYSITVEVTDADTAGNGASVHSTAIVADAALGSSCATPVVSPMSFGGAVAILTDANPSATAADFVATISWGDGTSSAGAVSGPTGGPLTISGSHDYSATGSETIAVTVGDDGGSTTSVSGCLVLIYGSLSSGAFAIGDGNGAIGTSVTFWGPQWSATNVLSGGPAPASFKGFANSPASMTCGSNWTTQPANSAAPPDGPLPAFMSVILTSASSQTNSLITGNAVHMVVVQTNADYAPAVGHAGTGLVVAQIC